MHWGSGPATWPTWQCLTERPLRPVRDVAATDRLTPRESP
jgi:hypothetical protein